MTIKRVVCVAACGVLSGCAASDQAADLARAANQRHAVLAGRHQAFADR